MKFVLHFSIITLFILSVGCKKEVPSGNEKLPDLVVSVDAKQGGTTIESIDFQFVEQQGSGAAAANGSHQTLTGLFTMLASSDLSSVGPKLGITTSFSELKTMTIDLETAGGSLPTIASYTTADGKSYQGTTGTVKFAKVDLYQDIGVGAADYFIDLEVSLTLTNVMDANDIITVEGDLLGLNIKQQ